MQCTIFYEDWQIQCCGSPFKIGETVQWTGDTADSNIKEFHIDFIEDHHMHGSLKIEGIVKRILAVTSEEEPHKKKYSFSEADFLFHDIDEADGYESLQEDTEKIHYIFWGYIVTLEDAKVSAINKQRLM